MRIRPASSQDAEGIAALWNPIIRNSAFTFNSAEKSQVDVADMIAQRDQMGHGTWVAEGRGILGFATYGQFRAGSGYAHSMEHTIILAPKARGRGIGGALMRALETHARAAGAHSMMAGVSGENRAAQEFHAALGYQLVAVVPQVGRKFGRWMDLHLMQKFL